MSKAILHPSALGEFNKIISAEGGNIKKVFVYPSIFIDGSCAHVLISVQDFDRLTKQTVAKQNVIKAKP